MEDCNILKPDFFIMQQDHRLWLHTLSVADEYQDWLEAGMTQFLNHCDVVQSIRMNEVGASVMDLQTAMAWRSWEKSKKRLAVGGSQSTS